MSNPSGSQEERREEGHLDVRIWLVLAGMFGASGVANFFVGWWLHRDKDAAWLLGLASAAGWVPMVLVYLWLALRSRNKSHTP